MDTYYSKEDNVQILLSLMKQQGIRKVIASPGTTNINFVASVQQDPFFEIYSSVDERSAAYIACGLAAESGEPVALSCTGATASRNYIPGLTEAFYRKLPVLAITATQHESRIGQNIAQVIDRRSVLNDMAKLSVQAPIPQSDEDRWGLNVQLNRALTELRRAGGGPVHINLETAYNKDFTVKELPNARSITHICYGEEIPRIPQGRVAIFVGDHGRWEDSLIDEVEEFCEKYNGVVLCDHTSNYPGKYKILGNLITDQEEYRSACVHPDLLIHIGNVSGAYMLLKPKTVWRVNPDGEIRDTYKRLSVVFEMKELDFFHAVNSQYSGHNANHEYYMTWKSERDKLEKKVPELPLSNAWIAQQITHRLPEGSVLYLGILNTLRTWNYFETPDSVTCYSNTGGFGIDGGVSATLGMSFADRRRLYFGVVGDLGFFYDMNALGNRHVGNNIRLMVINNGRGTEFRIYSHPAARFGEEADLYMAAAGHYGNQSAVLIEHYAEDLGYEYLCASNKDEFLNAAERFVTPELTGRPMVFEVFTDSKDESDALYRMRHIETDVVGTAKSMAKRILGEKGTETVKKMLGK